jgi:hypothetical protein
LWCVPSSSTCSGMPPKGTCRQPVSSSHSTMPNAHTSTCSGGTAGSTQQVDSSTTTGDDVQEIDQPMHNTGCMHRFRRRVTQTVSRVCNMQLESHTSTARTCFVSGRNFPFRSIQCSGAQLQSARQSTQQNQSVHAAARHTGLSHVGRTKCSNCI